MVVLAGMVLAVAGLAGCARQPAQTQPSQVVLSGGDPFCRVFPYDQLAEMLPPGNYKWTDHAEGINYSYGAIGALGSCVVGPILVSASVDVFGGLGDVTGLDVTCAGSLSGTLTVPDITPRTSVIQSSGQCTGTTNMGQPYSQVWAVYWGGVYFPTGSAPAVTAIFAKVFPLPGRDGFADATQLVQWVLDFIGQSYATADPNELGPTTPATPSSGG